MKKLNAIFLSASLLAAQHLAAQITSPSPYCSAAYTDMGGMAMHYISNVSIGSLTNHTGDTSFAAPHYVYYNTLTAPALVPGNSYTLTVTHDPETIGGMPNTIHWVAAYIDFNRDNDFEDTGELVLSQGMTAPAPPVVNPSVASITIPASTTPGITRMRVIVNEDDMVWSAAPCSATGFMWGETEDYNVNITTATAVNTFDSDGTMALWPNPAADFINVASMFDNNDYSILDLAGRTLITDKVRLNTIDIKQLEAGQYILRITTNNTYYTQRFVVQKP